jgi:hypothetical protein
MTIFGTWIVSIVSFFIYAIGVFIVVDSETEENIKFHKGGFLGLGDFSSTHREIQPKDVRLGLIWPLFLLIFFVKGIVWTLNSSVNFIGLIFGLHYGRTALYKMIDNWTFGN